MAEKKPVKASPKRRVKDPETFRERALKAQDAASRPDRKTRAKRAGGKLAEGSGVKKSLSGINLPKPAKKVFRTVGKIIFPAYFRNSWRELKLVTWPSWKESRQLTFAVIIFALVFGASIAVVDYGLDKVFRSILLK